MKKIKIFSLISIIAIFLGGCEPESEFLEADNLGVINFGKVSDYNLLFENNNILGDIRNTDPTGYMADNLKLSPFEASQLSGTSLAMYKWDENLYEIQESPHAWTQHYKAIFTYNAILNEIDDAVDANVLSNIELIKKYKAEALLGRAFEHLWLVNLYAQPYSSDNLSTPGIPYMYTADVSAPTPSRETLVETYKKIETDLLNALENLPETNDARRGSKLAAYGVLTRMYLYMQNYDKVIEYAQQVLDIKSDVNDYTLFPALDAFGKHTNPDNLYVRYINENPQYFFKNPTEDLAALYSALDARALGLYYFNLGSLVFWLDFFQINSGVTLPEIILCKAEAHARKGELSQALEALNNLERKRIIGFTDLNSNNQEEVLTWVLNERRRETANNGLRFADMRRLQLEGRIGTITHTVDEETISLEEGSNKYTLQIPQIVLDKNPEMEPNPR
ncbi:RagB/SusD family nutrient uptake outer membrane protein [Flavivirga eckloniae]|uniref:RagB/SusD family nutrient uptake outer membrane protein n=1 Tax=Flavivirga eckloniae TaxID=1803846 RepID=A0A2K9PW33_9FLAO|nr:RagB/SusD family nutrient uptake outer membrane protein [Flavivirga eckloniae]AUP81250.1 hypothetical protein C1H87_22040 [Flavivirga eckloniae]